jgi:hypothetical protein
VPFIIIQSGYHGPTENLLKTYRKPERDLAWSAGFPARSRRVLLENPRMPCPVPEILEEIPGLPLGLAIVSALRNPWTF